MTETTAFDLLTEARWEMEGIRRAARRYREAASSKDPASLPSGQRLLRSTIPPLSAEIGRLREEGLASIRTPTGTLARWAWPIQLLDSQTLALLTVIHALGTSRGPLGRLSPIVTVSRELGQGVRREVEYRAWVEAQIAANKAAREAKDWDHVDLLRALKARHPEVNRVVWGRWKRRAKLLLEEPWDHHTTVVLGATMIGALAQACPDQFSIVPERIPGGRTQNRLELSAETQAVMDDVEQRSAVSRPVLMPMLIPPIPWRYEG